MALNYGDSRYTSGALAYGDFLFVEQQLTIPVINLIGSGVTLNQGDAYVEQGFSAVDDVDGDITDDVVVTGSININVAGTYTLRYNVVNSEGNSAAEVIRLVIVIDFWEYIPPQNRIIEMTAGTQHVKRDPDSTLSYWLDMSGLTGAQAITSIVVDPDSTLDGLTVDCTGLNTQSETDNLGSVYQAGELIGLCLSGGEANSVHRVVIRYTLTGGDIDDRTLVVHMVQQ